MYYIQIMIEKYALLKVMKEVLVNADKRYSVNETAKKSGVSVFAAKHMLDYLFKKEMLTLEKIGRTYQYKANLDNCLTRQWKITLSLEEIDDAGIVRNILKQSASIFNIVLYGSVGQGRDDGLSDIDIIVIADVDKEKKNRIMQQAKGTKREVNISVYTPMEWRKKARVEKAFYDTVVIDSISLYGGRPVVL